MSQISTSDKELNGNEKKTSDPESTKDNKRIDHSSKESQSGQDKIKSSSEKIEKKNHHHSSSSKSNKRDVKDADRKERRHSSRDRKRDKRSKYDRDDRRKHSRHNDRRRSRSSSTSSSSDSDSSYKKRNSHQKSSSRYESRTNRHNNPSSRHRSRSRSKERRDKIRDYEQERSNVTTKDNKTENCSSSQIKETLENKSSISPVKNTDTNQTSSELNINDILKTIEIPKEIRTNPQEIAKYQAEQLKKKAEELTGIKVPSFYNATAINPLLYAEQQRKRKLLWSKPKDNEITSTKLVGKAIVEGQDEKTAEKFRKLMGIKSLDKLNDPSDDNKSPNQLKLMQKQAFEAMDKEYEYARMTTHLNRGKGLGFASHAANILLDPNQRTNLQ